MENKKDIETTTNYIFFQFYIYFKQYAIYTITITICRWIHGLRDYTIYILMVGTLNSLIRDTLFAIYANHIKFKYILIDYANTIHIQHTWSMGLVLVQHSISNRIESFCINIKRRYRIRTGRLKKVKKNKWKKSLIVKTGSSQPHHIHIGFAHLYYFSFFFLLENSTIFSFAISFRFYFWFLFPYSLFHIPAFSIYSAICDAILKLYAEWPFFTYPQSMQQGKPTLCEDGFFLSIPSSLQQQFIPIKWVTKKKLKFVQKEKEERNAFIMMNNTKCIWSPKLAMWMCLWMNFFLMELFWYDFFIFMSGTFKHIRIFCLNFSQCNDLLRIFHFSKQKTIYSDTIRMQNAT